MITFEQNLVNYAKLAVKVGANVQKGQEVIVKAPIIAKELVRLITEKAYEVGAKRVYYNWTDEQLDILRLKNLSESEILDYPAWKTEMLETLVKRGACCIDIKTIGIGMDEDVDPYKIALDQEITSKALNTYYSYRISDRINWTILIYPTVEWAKRLFPKETREKAMNILWNIIFKMTRAYCEEPIKAWNDHLKTLTLKRNNLNHMKYSKLYFEAPGTDLEISFDLEYHWKGGVSVTDSGIKYVANIPTEEVYTVPVKTGVNGIVTSTKPLNYGGTLIEKLTLEFEKGRIINASSERGEDTLRQLIETDEGSHYLGEVALVPKDSPISLSGIIFYATLFDENASCHLAIGKGFPTCLEGGEGMSEVERKIHGVNDSAIHVDFMIGSDELNIDGETDFGHRKRIFRNGMWAN